MTGAGPHVKDLAACLRGALSILVESKDSTGVVEKSPKGVALTDSLYRGVSLTAIIGSGLATADLEFNLTPDSVKLRKGLEDNAKGLTVLGMLIMAVLVAFSVYGTSMFFLKRTRLTELKSELMKIVVSAQDLAKKQEIVNEINKHKGPEFSMVNLLSEVHSLLPAGVLLDSVDIDMDAPKEQVRLSGNAGANVDVSSFVKNLEQSPLLKDAKDTRGKDQESGKYNFKISCSLEKSK
jgi:Tfp pilus assembly protein PilN